MPLKSPCQPISVAFGDLRVYPQAPIFPAFVLSELVSQVEILSYSQGEFCATAEGAPEDPSDSQNLGA